VVSVFRDAAACWGGAVSREEQGRGDHEVDVKKATNYSEVRNSLDLKNEHAKMRNRGARVEFLPEKGHPPSKPAHLRRGPSFPVTGICFPAQASCELRHAMALTLFTAAAAAR